MLAGIILSVLYSLLLIYLTVQLFTMIQERHKKSSFKFGFNILCFAWNLLRVLFWVMLATDVSVPPFWSYFMWWLPHSVMYATFSLLALFFAKLVTPDLRWRTKWRRRLVLLFVVTTCLDAAGTVIWIVMASHGDDASTNTATNDESLMTGSVFFVLSIVFLLFGCKLFGMHPQRLNRLFVLKPKRAALTNWLLFLIFTSRSIFDYLTSFNVVDVQISFNGEKATTTVILVGSFVAWELLPTVVLLGTIARGKRGTRLQHEPTYGKFGVSRIEHSPKADKAAAEQRLRAGLLPVLPEDHGHETEFGAVGYGEAGRRGSVGDEIIQGDARYGTFQTNIFGLSPAWYTAGSTPGDPGPSYTGPSSGPGWRGDPVYGGSTDVREGDYGMSPMADDSLHIHRQAAHRRADVPRAPSDAHTHAEYLAAAAHLAEPDAGPAVGSVTGASGPADANVFTNPHRYDTPPTHEEGPSSRWRQRDGSDITASASGGRATSRS